MNWRRAVVAGVASFVALLPLTASAASQSDSTVINVTVAQVISISTSTPVSIGITPTPSGVVSSSSDTVTVNTNSSTGWNLTLSDADTDTDLESGANAFAAHAGTQASPTALADNTWGYRIVGVGGFGGGAYSGETNNGSSSSTWAGVPSSAAPNTIKTSAGTATNDTTTIWYGVRATSSQPSGVYTDTVTYTATTT
jgi:hypothetical protein